MSHTLPIPATPHGYAGIGSRSCPDDILALMYRIAAELAQRGWTLRSGAAPGADSAFEAGALAAGGRVGLYCPGAGSRGAPSISYCTRRRRARTSSRPGSTLAGIASVAARGRVARGQR